MSGLSTWEVIEAIKEWWYSDVIFDFDETIAHLIIDWSTSRIGMKELAINYWIEQEQESMNSHAFAEFVIQKYGNEGKQNIDKICGRAESEHLSNIVVNQELVNFIKTSSDQYTFHILSNNMCSTINNALEEMGIWEYFTLVFGRDSVLFSKPHPEWIEEIIKKQWGDSKNFVMIGDNPDSDIAAADRAGIASLVINMHIT